MSRLLQHLKAALQSEAYWLPDALVLLIADWVCPDIEEVSITLPAHSGWISDQEASPDGATLVTMDSSLWIRDATDLTLLHKRGDCPVKSAIRATAISPDSRFVFTGDNGKAGVRAWDLQMVRQTRSLTNALVKSWSFGHYGMRFICCLRCNPANGLIASVMDGWPSHVVLLLPPRLQAAGEPPVTAVELLVENTGAAIAWLSVKEEADASANKSASADAALHDKVLEVRFTPDGRLLVCLFSRATATRLGSVPGRGSYFACVWESPSMAGFPSAVLPEAPRALARWPVSEPVARIDWLINGLAVAPNSQRMCTCLTDRLAVWSLERACLSRAAEAPPLLHAVEWAGARSAAYAPDGRLLFATGAQGLGCFAVATAAGRDMPPQLVQVLELVRGSLVLVTGDGARLITATLDRVVQSRRLVPPALP